MMALWNDISPHECVYGARHFIPDKSVSSFSGSSLSLSSSSLSDSFLSASDTRRSSEPSTDGCSLDVSAIAFYIYTNHASCCQQQFVSSPETTFLCYDSNVNIITTATELTILTRVHPCIFTSLFTNNLDTTAVCNCDLSCYVWCYQA